MALIKKGLIALILLVPFLLWTGINTYAAWGTGVVSSEPDLENNNADIYHVLIGEQRAYIHMSLPRYSLSGQYMNSYVTNSTHEIKFYGSSNIHYDYNIWNPDSSKYNVFIIETLDNQGNYVTQYNSMESSHNILRFMGTSDGIQISTVEPSFPYTEEAVYYLFDNVTYRLYWAKSNVHTNIKIEDLPLTTGSPYKTGSYGTVDFRITGSYLDTTIFYQDTFKLERKLIDDISVFENVRTAFYWTDNNDRFITITYEEEPPVFLSSASIEARPWVNAVTWNLTTNEIRSINKIDVFAYHDKDNNRNIFTYMYIPELIVDSLISVTASFTHQFTYYIGGKGEPIQNTITLKSGSKNTFSPTWEKKLLYYSVSPVLTLTDIGSKILKVDVPFVRGSLDQIQTVIPTSELENKIIDAWEETYDTKVTIDTDANKLYKLNWGQFDKFGASDVSLMPNSFSFAEIVFVKDGRVNFLEFDDIILKDVTDTTLLPENAKTLWTILSKFYNDYPEIAIVIVIVLVMIVLTLLLQFAPVVGMFAQLISGILRVVFMLLSKPIVWVLIFLSGIGYYISTIL